MFALKTAVSLKPRCLRRGSLLTADTEPGTVLFTAQCSVSGKTLEETVEVEFQPPTAEVVIGEWETVGGKTIAECDVFLTFLGETVPG